jgi:4-aminobutyrate aminotransferase-like enzyme
MSEPIQHPRETLANELRHSITTVEPRALRTFTPTQLVIARSAGVFHWTPEGRRLYDFTSGVLVANLGHNPTAWLRKYCNYMGWPTPSLDSIPSAFVSTVPMTAYNAITPIERDASLRLVQSLQRCPGGKRLEQVMWAASGSEAVHKAIWVALARDRGRPMILATRNGFHGKKGFANAVTGSEVDGERDPRVRFISFPTKECRDLSLRDEAFDPAPYMRELDALLHQFGRKIGTLITEPYLGGGGSYHPPKAYLQLLNRFCKQHDIVFILDEVQANFGRTGALFAFETYGLEPDIVVLGKGLGNGVPVAAAVGRSDLFAALDYGEASDTWSANPLCCAAVLATLDEFESRDILTPMQTSSATIESGLVQLKRFPFVAQIRGERGGMVWGIETKEAAGKTATEWANAFVLACYHGNNMGGDGIHLLGPLAKKVVRIAPPLVITKEEAAEAVSLMTAAAHRIAPVESLSVTSAWE